MPVKSKQQLLREVTDSAERMVKIRNTAAKNRAVNSITEPEPLRTTIGELSESNLRGSNSERNNTP